LLEDFKRHYRLTNELQRMDSSSDNNEQLNPSSSFGTGSFQTPSPQSTSHPRNSSVASSATSSDTFMSTYSQQMAAPESTPQAKQLDQHFPSNTQSSSGQNPPGQPYSQGRSSHEYAEQPGAQGYSPNSRVPTATSPFLKDFSLVAEAARRAQMSILARDLDGITL
jgi:hypothetical protein